MTFISRTLAPLCIVGPTLYGLGCAADVGARFEEADAVSSPISKGHAPAGATAAYPYLSGVVKLVGERFACTAVLISPRYILSAAHCFGTATEPGITGGDPACWVEDGRGAFVRAGGCGAAAFTHTDGVARDTITLAHVWVSAAKGPSGPPSASDLAVGLLERPASPATAAGASPTPAWYDGDPGAGYWAANPIVYAGWGRTDSVTDTCAGLRSASINAVELSVETRKRLDASQPVVDRSVVGSLGGPMFVANFDLYGDSAGLTLPGDSGGPLFGFDGFGRARVIGDVSGGACKNDFPLGGTTQNLWARTLNTDNAALVRNVLFGLGGRDSDGDGVRDPIGGGNGWISDVDNCPAAYNPDQVDSNGDGVGDACDVTVGRRPAGSVVGFDGRCVGVAGWLDRDWSPVTTWDCVGSPGQAWTYEAAAQELHAFGGASPRNLDVYLGMTSAGTPVQIYPDISSAAQRFRFEDVAVRGIGGMCIDDAAWRVENGNPLQQWRCELGGRGNIAQQFSFMPDGSLQLNAVLNEAGRRKCVDLSLGDMTSVQLWDCNGWDNQKWALGPGGELRAFNGKSNLCMEAEVADLRAFSPLNGRRLRVAPCNGRINQKFAFFGAIHTVGNKCLDVAAFGRQNGTKIQLWDCNGYDNQRFEYTW